MPNKMDIPEIEISVRYKNQISLESLHLITSSKDCAEVLRACFNADTMLWREEFILLCLNRANKVIGFFKVSSGGISGTVADPKVIFTVLLNSGASAFILAHNHPSGNLKPSEADIKLTKQIVQGANLLSLSCLDHIIITNESHLSFADEGLI